MRRAPSRRFRAAPVSWPPVRLGLSCLVWLAGSACGSTGDGLPGGGPSSGGGSTATGEPVVRIAIEDNATYMSQFQAAPDRLLIQVLPGSLSDAAALAAGVGASLQSFDARTGTAVVNVRQDRLAITAARLDALAEIERLDRDYFLPTAAAPADPLYASQWHLPRVELDAAWDVTRGDPQLILAVVDTGVDVNHPDLAARMTAGYNFVTSSTDASDCCGHGTMVAGVLGAVTDNGVGVAGAAWHCRIMPVRVARFDGVAETAKLSDIARGILFAVDNGARVINVSFSGVLGSATIQTAAQYAYVNDRLVVAAMGNSGQRDPAPDSPWMLSVSATDSGDRPASFTTYGPGVDLAAPGVGILTTARSGAYQSVNGTSFSSPLTAGVVALMWSAAPAASTGRIVDLLLSAADDLGPAGFDEQYGRGRLNARRAVESARDAVLPPDTSAPVATITIPPGGSILTDPTRVSVEAVDDTGVRSVTLAIDGQVVATDATRPYVFLVDPRGGPAGPHRVTAAAIDAAGNRSAHAVLDVVFDHGRDETPPSADLLTPPDGATFTSKTTVAFRLDDPQGLRRVSIQIDGQTAGGADLTGNGARVEVDIDPSALRLAPGPHVLGVSVRNAAGLTAARVVNFGVP